MDVCCGLCHWEVMTLELNIGSATLWENSIHEHYSFVVENILLKTLHEGIVWLPSWWPKHCAKCMTSNTVTCQVAPSSYVTPYLVCMLIHVPQAYKFIYIMYQLSHLYLIIHGCFIYRCISYFLSWLSHKLNSCKPLRHRLKSHQFTRTYSQNDTLEW